MLARLTAWLLPPDNAEHLSLFYITGYDSLFLSIAMESPVASLSCGPRCGLSPSHRPAVVVPYEWKELRVAESWQRRTRFDTRNKHIYTRRLCLYNIEWKYPNSNFSATQQCGYVFLTLFLRHWLTFCFVRSTFCKGNYRVDIFTNNFAT